MHGQRKKPCEETSTTKPQIHEATDAEETEEFSLIGDADVYALQFNKRVPETRLSKRVHITAADKKKVNKALISLPVPRTLKLFIYNTRPFILEFTSPVKEFCERYSASQLFNIILEASRLHSRSAPAVLQRTSLSGTTLNTVAHQQRFAALPSLPPDLSQNFQRSQISNDITSPVIHQPHHNNIEPELLEKVYNWLDHVNTPIASEAESSNLVSDSVNIPIATDPGFSNFVPGFVISEDVWDLIEQTARQRKSRLRQMPNKMLTETNNTSLRGSNNTRPSGSFLRLGENHTRKTTNSIEDHPGTSFRRPKSMPSGSQLPPCWNDEMDEFICHMEAQCEFSIRSIVRALKQRFAVLREVSASCFPLKLWWLLLTLHLACDSGRGHPTSHRHP